VFWQIKERDQTAYREGEKTSKKVRKDASSDELSTVTRLAADSGSVHAECLYYAEVFEKRALVALIGVCWLLDSDHN
jgi:hypothetical protein